MNAIQYIDQTIRNLVRKAKDVIITPRKIYKPDFYFQGLSVLDDVLKHPLFGLDNVHLYIGCHCDYAFVPPGYQEVHGSTGADHALAAAYQIEYAYNTMKKYYPQKQFKYAIWPHNFYIKNVNSVKDNSLYHHDDDKVEVNGQMINTLYHENGIKSKRVWADDFFRCLKKELSARNLPDPTFCDPDDEDEVFHYWMDDDFKKVTQYLLSDPRSKSVLFDGEITLDQYLHTFKDYNGNPVPFENLLVSPYANNLTAHLYWSITFRARDYCLQQSLFLPMKKYFPNTKSQNWLTFAAKRGGFESFNTRFCESAVDFNTTMKMDRQVPSFYGFDWVDIKGFDGYFGYKTVNNAANKYGINTGLPTDNLLQQIYLKNIDFNLNACQKAAPTKETMMWFALLNSSLGDQYVNGSGQLIIDQSLLNEVAKIASKYNIKSWGLFEPNPSQTTLDTYYHLATIDLPKILQ